MDADQADVLAAQVDLDIAVGVVRGAGDDVGGTGAADHDRRRKRVRRLMAKMGLAAIYQKPRTSEPHPAHRTYKYLLRHLAVDRANQVWCADITYIPMRRGFLYLVVVMDWATRKVLAWRLSNTMDAEFCIAALEEAMARFGAPEIFNSERGNAIGPRDQANQGSQFTSPRFVQRAALPASSSSRNVRESQRRSLGILQGARLLFGDHRLSLESKANRHGDHLGDQATRN